MSRFRDFLRADIFLARVFTFAMIPFFWRFSIAAGRWLGYEDHLILIGSMGIWLGVILGHNLYYRWIFPEKRNPQKG